MQQPSFGDGKQRIKHENFDPIAQKHKIKIYKEKSAISHPNLV